MAIFKNNGPRWDAEDFIYIPTLCTWGTVEAYDAKTAKYTVRIHGTLVICGPGDVSISKRQFGEDELSDVENPRYCDLD